MNKSVEDTTSSLIERASKMKEVADTTVPFHAPKVAPTISNELLKIRFEAMRNCITDETLDKIMNDAEESLKKLVKYYQMYFTKVSFK